MKLSKILLALAMVGGAAQWASAQGYKDGVDYYNADRFEEAGIILNNTLSQPGTDKGVAYFYLGNLALRQGNAAEAKADFDKGVAANPGYGYNYIGLGGLALRQGDAAEAEKLFKQGMATDKKDAALTVAVARAYFNADPVKYAKDVEKYIKKAEKDSKYQEPAIFILKGDMLKNTNAGEAAGNYEMAMEYGEQMSGEVNPEAYVKYANLYNKSNPQFAITKLEALAQKLPDSAMAQRELAEKYYDGNQLTRAAQQYGKYMANPNHFQSDEQRYSGLLYFGKDYAKSLEVANNVLAKDPGNLYMHRMVMLNNAALENWQAADEAAQKLFANAGAQFTANDYTTYGDVLAALERPQEALAAYEKAYNLNPDKNKAILAQMSSMYSDLEDYAKATELMQKFVDAGDATLNDMFILSNRYKNLAITLPEGSAERKAAAQKGIEYVDLALRDAATKGPLYRNKATLLMVRDGAEPSAEIVETYQAMIDAYNENPENADKHKDVFKSAYNSIGSYYHKQGDNARAREYYQKMLELDPDNQALKDYIKKL